MRLPPPPFYIFNIYISWSNFSLVKIWLSNILNLLFTGFLIISSSILIRILVQYPSLYKRLSKLKVSMLHNKCILVCSTYNKYNHT